MFEDLERIHLEEGDGKYVLVEITEGDHSILAVRQDIESEYHIEVYERLFRFCQLKRWRSEVLGGGRIQFDSAGKKIFIYSKSLQYGRADHSVTAQVLKTKYPDYEIMF